jgi:hypothetical protein
MVSSVQDFYESVYACLYHEIRGTCPAHFIRFHFIILVLFGEKYTNYESHYTIFSILLLFFPSQVQIIFSERLSQTPSAILFPQGESLYQNP